MERCRYLASIMITITVSITVSIAVMVLVVPVAFMEPPALSLMIIVGMAPIGAFKRSPFPVSRNPAIVTTVRRPVSVDPIIAWTGSHSTLFVADRRRADPAIYPHPRRPRNRHICGHYCTHYPIES